MTDLDTIPEATAATADLVCWLWAAYPPRNGRIPVRRVADDLGVHERTVRRWITGTTPHEDHYDKIMRRLRQRAILRGHGNYPWPNLDAATAYRQTAMAQTAASSAAAIAEGTYPHTWRDNGTLEPHEILLVEYPKAHVYGIHAVSTLKARQRIERTGLILQEAESSNRYAAQQLKYAVLLQLGDHRCIVPKKLVPGGHTETWRPAGGRPDLTDPSLQPIPDPKEHP